MKKILGTIVGICLIVGAIALYRSLSQGPLFYREATTALPQDTARFRCDKTQGRIFYKTKTSEEWLDKLPNYQGGFFSLRQIKRIHFTPRYAKTNGLYSFVYFRSRGKNQPIAFTLYRKRVHDYQKIHSITTTEAAFPLIVEPTLRKGDELIFEFSGQGIVYFSRPVFYRPTALHKREYVFLIAPDTFRSDVIGAERHGVKLTPNIDKFIQDSVCFPNTFAQSSWTVPSFISLFTARYAYNHGVGIGNSLDLAIPTLTSRLAEKFITFGYHGGLGLRSRWGYSRNFDHYEDFPPAGPFNPRGGYSLFEKTLELVKTATFPRTFLFLHTYQVHEPYTPPAEFLKKLNTSPKYSWLGAVNSMHPEKTFLTVASDQRLALQELYEAEVMAFDHYFGWFISELRQLGIYDRAMIVFTSDHGEEFFEHGGWAHSHSLYNELLRVPLIIKFPEQAHAGMRPGSLAGLIDVLPTLLEYYHLPPVASPIDGISLMPALSGKTPRQNLISDIALSRYIEAIPPKFALFFNKTKLIYNYPASAADLKFFAPFGLPPETPLVELFDINRDPWEHNRILPAQFSAAKALFTEMRRVKKEIEKALLRRGYSFPALDAESLRILRSLGYL
jgi:arylsulfatase A-like enzyme